MNKRIVYNIKEISNELLELSNKIKVGKKLNSKHTEFVHKFSGEQNSTRQLVAKLAENSYKYYVIKYKSNKSNTKENQTIKKLLDNAIKEIKKYTKPVKHIDESKLEEIVNTFEELAIIELGINEIAVIQCALDALVAKSSAITSYWTGQALQSYIEIDKPSYNAPLTIDSSSRIDEVIKQLNKLFVNEDKKK